MATLSGDNIDSHLARPLSLLGTLQICTFSLCLFPFLFHFGEKYFPAVSISSVTHIAHISCAESENDSI